MLILECILLIFSSYAENLGTAANSIYVKLEEKKLSMVIGNHLALGQSQDIFPFKEYSSTKFYLQS